MTPRTHLATHRSLLPRTLGAAAVAAAAVAAVLTGQAPTDAATSAPSAAAAPTCFGETATIRGTGLLRGTPGDDVIVAGDAGTEVQAGGGDDRICGAFIVYGGTGDDRIAFFRTGYAEAELRGQAGRDRIYSSTTFAYLYGGQDDDVLVGGGGEQWVLGEGGNDRLVGGRGPDHLLGGTGRDRADGGAGRDDCDAELRRACEG
ncbi:calcium-binding protein [Nocardioides nanhaiensis]|uniref:Calcium-binding protein n=1 Tax=Nocardioides nanhaiensis TaxID=1476871 RepID=A0ABP8WF79_9ACTN